MSADKYPGIFSRQMEAVVYLTQRAGYQRAITQGVGLGKDNSDSRKHRSRARRKITGCKNINVNGQSMQVSVLTKKVPGLQRDHNISLF